MNLFQKLKAYLFGTRYAAYCDYQYINSFEVGPVIRLTNGEYLFKGFFCSHHLKPSEEGTKWFFLN